MPVCERWNWLPGGSPAQDRKPIRLSARGTLQLEDRFDISVIRGEPEAILTHVVLLRQLEGDPGYLTLVAVEHEFDPAVKERLVLLTHPKLSFNPVGAQMELDELTYRPGNGGVLLGETASLLLLPVDVSIHLNAPGVSLSAVNNGGRVTMSIHQD